MPRLLVAAFGQEGIAYVDCATRLGMTVQVLDCFEDTHRRLQRWHGDLVLHAAGNRADVAAAVAQAHFDVAIIHEDHSEFIRSALITQSLRESSVRFIMVITPDGKRVSMYRRCGAHQVIVANSVDHACRAVEATLLTFASA